jgi:hypothetical protein
LLRFVGPHVGRRESFQEQAEPPVRAVVGAESIEEFLWIPVTGVVVDVALNLCAERLVVDPAE